MGETDKTQKTLEDYLDVFVDIVNGLLFRGDKVITPEELRKTQVRSIFKADGDVHEQERDNLKEWIAGNYRIAMVGLENQTEIDAEMPLRVISYDGSEYKRQLLEKKHQYAPVITLVLYFGKRHWVRPRRLFDVIRVPKRLVPYTNDYNLNVFEIAYLSEEELERFDSDFRIVAEHFVYSRTNPDYQPSERKMQHVDETLKLMRILTGDNRYEEAANRFSRKENITMCEVLDFREQRGIQIGERKFAKLSNLLLSENRIDDLRRATEDEGYMKKLFEEYNLEPGVKDEIL